MTQRLNNDFQFLEVERHDPGKKDMASRTKQFVEIYDPFTKNEVEDNQIAA